MSYGGPSFIDSFKRLNLLTSAFAIVFAFTGLVMTGLLDTVLSLIESHKMVPLIVALVSLLIMWASSNTRDPSYYHPAELGVIGAVVALMIMMIYWPPMSDLVTSNQPWTGVGVMGLMVVAGAIVMR